MEKDLLDTHHNKIWEIIKPLGFEETNRLSIFRHKMLDGGVFDLSASSTDGHWVMHNIFKTTISHGKRLKEIEVLTVLGLM
jgi:hypothetical protein